MRLGSTLCPLVFAAAVGASVGAALLAATPLSAQTGARRWSVERQESQLVVLVDRAGLLSFLGHRHAIVPTDWRGELCLGRQRPRTGGSARIVISTPSLVIDSDSARALAGLGDGPGEEDRREVQEKMLGGRFLAASEHPEIVVETREVRWEDEGEAEVRASLGIRGITREVTVPVRFREVDAGRIRVDGRVRIRQTDFGMQPESVAGVVKVADEVELRFDLVAEPTDEPCTVEGESAGQG